MDASVPPPSVSEPVLTDWTQTEETTDVLFDIPGVTVAGHTHVYERDDRFVFLTRLAFEPSLPSVFKDKVESIVLQAAKDRFRARLSARGATAVEYDAPRQHPQAPAAVQLVPFESTREDDTPYAGYLGLCRRDDFVLGGGAYPAAATETQTYEEDVLAVLAHAR